MIAVYLYDHRIEPKKLKYVQERYCGIEAKEMPFDKDPRECDPKVLRRYNCQDAWVGVKVADWFIDRLTPAQKTLQGWLGNTVLAATTEATYNGIQVDQKHMTRLVDYLQTKISKAVRKLGKIAPKVDLSSTDSILGHVFGKLKHTPLAYTEKSVWKIKPKWCPSKTRPKWDKTTKVALVEEDTTGFVKQVVRRDKLRKVLQTYCSNIQSHSKYDGRIHSRFILAKNVDVGGSLEEEKGGTVTGRLTMVRPSFQTLPKHTSLASRIRQLFVSRFFKSGVIFSADYSQVELRVAADLAKCEIMLDIFNDDKYDIHTFTAAEVFGVNYKHVTEDQRSRGKTVNFAVIYGCSPYKLVQLFAMYGMKLELSFATEIISRWYGRYVGFEEWQDTAEETAIRTGQIVTPTGRVEHIFANRETPEGRAGLRQAKNQPTQGGASDICTAAFTLLAEHFRNDDFFYEKAFVLGNVYDAIVTDVAKQKLHRVKELAQEVLTDSDLLVGHLGWDMEVPLKIDITEAPYLK